MVNAYPFFSFVLVFISFCSAVELSCFTDTTVHTLEDLVTCFLKYAVPREYYADFGDCATESASYLAAQPSPSELQAWSNAVTQLLNINGDENTCPDTTTDVRGIENDYAFTRFDDVEGQSFCLLHEKHITETASPIYSRGWGFVAVPAAQSQTARSIHFSVPHPLFDGVELVPQGAALFERTGAKSLVVSGRHRAAYPCKTNCSTGVNSTYYKTDPTHDIHEPFHTALVTALAWQKGSTCLVEPCGTFIQLHGKADDHCGNDNMFLSGGISSADWYTDHPTYPVNIVKGEINTYFEGSPAISPEDSDCDLTATRNVFARFINGVAEELVCTKHASKKDAIGQFIHVEQHNAMMYSSQYRSWEDALVATFPDMRRWSYADSRDVLEEQVVFNTSAIKHNTGTN